ncbi:MAG: hypothetical protein N2444_03085, partial [Methylocystis sp.]|nr:hypothetical protein [Methylocystis sp.]
MMDGAVEKNWRLIAARHIPGAFEFLDAAYREPQRSYHDWRHIGDLLEKLEKFSHLATRPDLIATAIF